MLPLEFRGEVSHEEATVMVLSSSEDRMSHFDLIRTDCERRADGQTDIRNLVIGLANTALCIAIKYADAL